MIATAVISADEQYRYNLTRIWDPVLPPLAFGMLNPSKANAFIVDPTVIKCIGFARRLGFGGISVFNLSAYRATKPTELWRAGFPVGEDNDLWTLKTVEWVAQAGGTIVLAWGRNGANPKARWRAHTVRHMLRDYDCWQLGPSTKLGQPWHPLMLSYQTPLIRVQSYT